MKKIMITTATVLSLSLSALSFAAGGQDFKALSAKAFKSTQSSSSSVKNIKNDVAMVYGGEDITHKLVTDSING